VKKMIVSALALLISLPLFAANYGEDRIHHLKWQGLDVVWLEDNRFPTYSIEVFFADGALSDGKTPGATTAMLALLSSGTRRFDQKDIADNLEFFGTGFGSNVTHEYSTISVSGLVKDIIPTMKKVCHLFDDATFPKTEIDKNIKLAVSSAQNIVADHSALASRAFRELSLMPSPYGHPSGGKISDLKRINQALLKEKQHYFNSKVKKRIYLSGPKEVLGIESTVLNECGWKGGGDFVRTSVYDAKVTENGPQIILVPVARANQAQVRIGRLLAKGEFEDDELLTLASDFIAGGFTSKLMRELRVKRGLTYSVGAFAQGQKDYGRAAISTFTKNQTLGELLEVTRQTLTDIAAGTFETEELERAQSGLAGGYPFRFENTGAYLTQLMFLDHVGDSYDRLYRFPEIIRGFNRDQVQAMVAKIFDWKKQTIVVVGDRSLEKELAKFGPVKVMKAEDFL
jgi:zinc protease